MEILNLFLINGSFEEEFKNILIVVFFVDIEELVWINIMKELWLNFGIYLNMNIIYVILVLFLFYFCLKGF